MQRTGRATVTVRTTLWPAERSDRRRSDPEVQKYNSEPMREVSEAAPLIAEYDGAVYGLLRQEYRLVRNAKTP